MKQVIFILLSAAVGFFTSILVLKGFKYDFSHLAEPFQIGLLISILILLFISFVKYTQIKNLSRKEVEGDEEDEVDVLIYKKYTDFSLLVQSSLILSILVMCAAITTTLQLIYIVLGIVALIISFLFSIRSVQLLKVAYPDRNIPSTSEKNFAEKLLAISDEGERHVLLIGLYKSYFLFTTALIIGIVLAALYSLSSGNSQLFSIIIMSLVLLMTHGKYSMAIRNK
ncbi:MAG TPA: DUF3169 family protein [Ureibacillus sp.]|nr:DUF3169 family protein [Ureibacillus sp.]